MVFLSYHKYFAAGLALLTAFPLAAAQADSETLPERELKQIVERQKEILAQAGRQGEKLDEESVRVQLQAVCHDYEILLHDSPKFAAAYAAYGILLGKIDMRKEAMGMLLKANQLDPDIALVKNQLGNYLAEDGKPAEAVNYYISAIKLAPEEPLYHYQLGSLLYEGRDELLKKGVYTRAQIDDAMAKAFKSAAELAPDRIEFTYRYAESFYDLENPNWDEALKVWGALEEKAPTGIERETMRLHAVNILIKQGKLAHARLLLEMVTDPALQGQKQKLVAQIAESAKK